MRKAVGIAIAVVILGASIVAQQPAAPAPTGPVPPGLPDWAYTPPPPPGGPPAPSALPADDRLDIYARSYVMRLAECLRAEFPVLRALIGEPVFDLFSGGYLSARPPSSPSSPSPSRPPWPVRSTSAAGGASRISRGAVPGC